MKKTELHISLTIFTGTTDPVLVANRLKVKAHRVFLRNELIIPKAKIRFKESGVEYRRSAARNLDLNLLIEKFLSNFEERTLKAVLAKYRSEFCAVLYSIDRSAVLWISPRNVKKISRLGLDVGIDYYILPEQTPED